MQDRIFQLERLVLSLVPSPSYDAGSGRDDAYQGNSALATTSDQTGENEINLYGKSSEAISDSGSMHVTASELRYVGGDHWAAILDSIADLKHHFDQEEQLRLADSNSPFQDDGHYTDPVRTAGAVLLYGGFPTATRSEILAALPPRDAVDRYVSRYFNRLDLVSCEVLFMVQVLSKRHVPRYVCRTATYIRQYEAFWADPGTASILWLGLLFSMIALALLASDDSDAAYGTDPPQTLLQADIYRVKVVQCLVQGEYTKCGPYALEAMLHYVYIEFLRSPDAHTGVWFLQNLTVSMAMRTGYHRDPRHLSGLTPFQGEMRRRVWAALRLGEVLLAGQMGLPRSVADAQCDTGAPRNLDDADLDPDATVLPAGRAETEMTTVLGLIARSRMVVALATIADLATAVETPSYAEVMRVDAVLQKTADTLPPAFRYKSMSASITDPPQTILARLFIRHMSYKGQLLLHRRYLFKKPEPNNSALFEYSQKTCLDASLGTLHIQHILDEETRPGGQLHAMRWRKTSIMNHQFLTATMVLCSLLYHGRTLNQQGVITSALTRARAIWLRDSTTSHEARKAAQAVSIVLARAAQTTLNTVDGDGRSFNDSGGVQDRSPITDQPWHGVANTYGDLDPSLIDDWTSFQQSANAFLDMDTGENLWPGGMPLL